MRRAASVTLGFFNCAVLVLGVCMIWQGYWQPTVGASSIEYKDFVSILLTALGIMIAILTAVIAVAAIWGFENIRSLAVKASVAESVKQSEAAALKAVNSFLEQTNPSLDYGAAAGEDKQNGHQQPAA